MQELNQSPIFDLGHRGDTDYTQIAKFLAMTPTQRLRHHEGWRQLLMRATLMPNFLEEMVCRLTKAEVEFVIVGVGFPPICLSSLTNGRFSLDQISPWKLATNL